MRGVENKLPDISEVISKTSELGNLQIQTLSVLELLLIRLICQMDQKI